MHPDLALRNLFVPVATTLKELSSLMGSRVGVKRWKDFAFFQATNQSDSLRPVITSHFLVQKSTRISTYDNHIMIYDIYVTITILLL